MRRNHDRWRSFETRLRRETTLWIATVRPDGRPHLTPVWFVWQDGKLYIAIGTNTQKFSNLQSNQSVAMALPDTDNVLIFEGHARVVDHETTVSIAELFDDKFDWDFRYDQTADWRLIQVTPNKVHAWGDDNADDSKKVD
jgi:general stress protein 26